MLRRDRNEIRFLLGKWPEELGRVARPHLSRFHDFLGREQGTGAEHDFVSAVSDQLTSDFYRQAVKAPALGVESLYLCICDDGKVGPTPHFMR